jgi:hypothetical protein
VNRVVAAMLPLLLATGCTVVLAPGEQQCKATSDCDARGFSGATCAAGVCEKAAVDPVWGCLGHVVEPVPDMTKKVELSVQIQFAGDKSPVTDATIDVCAKLDVGCTGMSADYPKGLKPDSMGLVKFSVIQGFDGFVRIVGPEIVDSLVFVGRPIVKPPAPKAVWLIGKNDYGILAKAAGQMVDPTRGTVILLGVDCQGIGASGVTFECPGADKKSLQFYLINQFPTAPPMATATDHDGFGGFFNVPVGNTLARSHRLSDGALVGESSFQVLANTISYVQIAPTPM